MTFKAILAQCNDIRRILNWPNIIAPISLPCFHPPSSFRP
jgi:hypothetical protein